MNRKILPRTYHVRTIRLLFWVIISTITIINMYLRFYYYTHCLHCHCSYYVKYFLCHYLTLLHSLLVLRRILSTLILEFTSRTYVCTSSLKLTSLRSDGSISFKIAFSFLYLFFAHSSSIYWNIIVISHRGIDSYSSKFI